MTRSRGWLLAAALLALAAGCQGLGEDGEGGDDDGNAFHRPGQDCLRCHGFAVAGTVYLRAGDPEGVSGAEVTIQDGAGHSFSAVSNRAGNFYVDVRTGAAAPSQGQNGSARIPWEPTYPLTVKLSYAGAEKVMRTSIHRFGACAACHGLTPSATSVGRVFVEDTP